MTELRKECITNIRGCLISVRGRIDMKQLSRDYKQLIGTDIPFKQLGFSSLEDFLKSEPSLSVSRSPDGQILVDAKANEKSSHISDMVQRQKATKKKPPKARKRYSSYTTSFQPSHQMQAPNKWRPKNVNTKWKNAYEPRPNIPMLHNQFVKLPPRHSPSPQPTKLPPRYSPSPLPPRVTPLPQAPKPVAPKKETPFKNNTKPNIAPKLEIITPEAKVLLDKNMVKNHTLHDKIPYSAKTNRSVIMSSPSPAFIDKLKVEAMAAIDITDPIWTGWTSSDSESSESIVQKAPFNTTGDAVVDFHHFLKYHKLADPIYNVCTRKSRPHNPTFYDCQIKVDGHSVSSYPKDFTDEMQAKYYASQLALEKLMAKYGNKRQSMLLSNEKDILERIPPLVQKHFSGIWSSQLEADYKDLYKEQLPSNWLEILDTSPVISIEAFGNKYVLQYFNPDDLLLMNKQKSTPTTSAISIPTSTVDFNEQGVLLAEITCAVSAKEIWCNQIGTPDANTFEIMINTLDLWYNDHYMKLDPPVLQKDSYYAAWHQELWHRVRLLDIDGDNYQCLFIDRGDDQKISKECLYTLVRPFAKEKAQAFNCRLAGLEELYEVSVGSEHILNLEGLVVQIEPCFEESVPYEPICVSLCDLETKEIINEKLISAISIENALPTLIENVPNEIFVTNYEPNGDVYLQLHTPGYDKLISLLSDLEISMSDTTNIPTEVVTPENSKNRLYFMKRPEDKCYNRVKIIDWSPHNIYGQIYYVDTGHAHVMKIADTTFHPLDMISSVISLYPEQALKVRLKLDGLPSNFVENLKQLLPKDSSVAVLGMVTGRNKDGLPEIKMFTRMQNVGLFSINEKLTEIKKQRDLRHEPVERNSMIEGIPSTGVLKSPNLPNIGSYFNVTVSSAVNPWNFFVQPYDTFEQLQNLMVQLQNKYSKVLYSPLGIDDLKPGQIYASKYEDGCWYRTCVIKVIHSSSISVFYCDFGHYGNLRLQQLVPLDPEFLELPFQAIKAKLSGIKPKNNKWTMEDCRYFQKHVFKKPLASILTSIEKDELYKSDKIVGLKLIDTSNKDNDIHIDQLLIQKLIAVAIS